MSDVAKEHDNVTLIDWYKRSEGHSEYFAPDGIHLENAGIKAMIDEILKHITPKKINRVCMTIQKRMTVGLVESIIKNYYLKLVSNNFSFQF